MSIAKSKPALLKIAVNAAAAVKALLIAASFTANVHAQDLDTAYIPFIVNADAAVTALGDGETNCPISAAKNKVDTLILTAEKGSFLSVLNGARMRQKNQALISGSHGKFSLNLPGQSYKNAEIILYSVNGKRILRSKVSASEAANKISRPNIAAGAYLLSVKGTNGSSFSTRLTHRGGSLNINVAFRDEPVYPGASQNISTASPKAAANSDGTWTITFSAEGYIDSVYQFIPFKGINPLLNITLSTGEEGYDPRLILDDGWAWVSEEDGEGIAFVFKNDGTAEAYLKSGVWLSNTILGTDLRWYTIGNRIAFVNSENQTTVTMFAVLPDGNTMILVYDEDGEIIILKKTEIDLSISEVDQALFDKDAWIDVSNTAGALWMFYKTGITNSMAIAMHNSEMYFFSTNGSTMTLTPIDQNFNITGPAKDVTYSISDNILTIDGRNYTGINMNPLSKIKMPKTPEMPKLKLPKFFTGE